MLYNLIYKFIKDIRYLVFNLKKITDISIKCFVTKLIRKLNHVKLLYFYFLGMSNILFYYDIDWSSYNSFILNGIILC